jgi:hypothetical protein
MEGKEDEEVETDAFFFYFGMKSWEHHRTFPFLLITVS